MSATALPSLDLIRPYLGFRPGPNPPAQLPTSVELFKSTNDSSQRDNQDANNVLKSLHRISKRVKNCIEFVLM